MGRLWLRLHAQRQTHAFATISRTAAVLASALGKAMLLLHAIAPQVHSKVLAAQQHSLLNAKGRQAFP